MTDPVEVLVFWFADSLTNPDTLAGRRAIWFMGGPDIDQLITEKFGTLPDAALAGELQYWTTDTRNTLALVLVLDQFPRNIYRNTARAYHYDSAGLNLAVTIIDEGLNLDLHPIEQSFLFLPLQHSESIDDQTRAVQLTKPSQLNRRAPTLKVQRIPSTMPRGTVTSFAVLAGSLIEMLFWVESPLKPK